ncbi:MAG: hypothetical protein R3B70_48890 [Polyangiaceae bacterium]
MSFSGLRAGSRGSPGGRLTLGLLAAAAICASAGEARADYLADLWNGRSEPVCPFVFGPGCKHLIHVDVMLAHQPTMSDDNGNETYFRAGFDLGYGHLVATDLHLGPAIEFGAQDGEFMTGFHIVPKLRARYWIAGGPVSLDLATGGYLGRSWLDTGDAARNRLGLQVDAGIGLLGFAQFVGGFVVNGDAAGVYGAQSQAFIGARVSLLTLLIGAAYGFKR